MPQQHPEESTGLVLEMLEQPQGVLQVNEAPETAVEDKVLRPRGKEAEAFGKRLEAANRVSECLVGKRKTRFADSVCKR